LNLSVACSDFCPVPDRQELREDSNFIVALRVEDRAMKRQRTNKTTFEEQLAEEAIRFKEAAKRQPPGSLARELLLRRARQAETASHINNWVSSPGLAAPK
jgi:hypothetical protein